jgi:hypothetical protein
MSKELKTVNIRGKEYVQVDERLRHFNAEYENGRIETEVCFQDQYVRCVARVWPDVKNEARYFTGHAEEDRTQGPINKTSAVENCETSAVGRALGMLGIGLIGGVATADEVSGAIEKQSTSGKNMSAKQKNWIKRMYEKLGKTEDEYAQWINKQFAKHPSKLTSQEASAVIEKLNKQLEEQKQEGQDVDTSTKKSTKS